MNEHPRQFRWFLAVGIGVGLLAGAIAGYWDLLRWIAVLAVFAIHCALVVLLWRVSIVRAILLGALGVMCFWLAVTLGFLIGKGRFEVNDLFDAFSFWAICTACVLLLLSFPRGRVPSSRRAPLRDYYSYSLRGMLLFISLVAVFLGIACLPRTEREHGGEIITYRLGSTEFVAEGKSVVDAWLLGDGYMHCDYTDSGIYFESDRDNHQIYEKRLASGGKIYVQVISSEGSILARWHATWPDTVLPIQTQQEIESERVERELRRAWNEYRQSAAQDGAG